MAAIFLKIVSPERRYNIYLEIGKFENSKGRRRVVKSGSSFGLKRRRKKRKKKRRRNVGRNLRAPGEKEEEEEKRGRKNFWRKDREKNAAALFSILSIPSYATYAACIYP